ncbi:chemotaxis protein CheA [Halobaculum sp. CBA1158]|uniref:chemotaxis protein CheA n=1 Tax=Halobaculum sp. CBA1158 TaxID=2904243 RepID=UPI001F41E6A5|nr:chemotaxis protein CheA [Halobaculum sp. CBA1158]UIP00081.1 chemotaxis protein CheA [Halobaculum sp. CBA1158]
MSDAHIRAFVRESEEGITELNNSLLALESDPDDPEAMDAIFRTAHTLKGNAAAMGFGDFSGLAHAMEDLLDEVRGGDMTVSGDLMDRLFEAVDLLDAMLGEIDETGGTDIDPTGVEDDLRTMAEEGVDGLSESSGRTGSEAAREDGADALDGDASADAAGDDATDDDGEHGPDAADGAGGGTDGDGEAADSDPIDPDFDHGLDPADDEGVYRATVDLGDADMPGIDAMFVLEAAEDGFGGLSCDPDRESIEEGEFEGTFDLYVSAAAAATVEAGVDAVSQVDAVAVDAVEPAPGDEGAAGEADAAGDDGGAADGEDSGDASGAGDATGAADDAIGVAGDAGVNDEDGDGNDDGSAGDADGDSEGGGTGGDSTGSSSTSDSISSVRVDVEQLDDLYGLVEQLVTSRIKLRREMEESGIDSDNLDELDKISSSLQDTVMDMRLIPLSAVVDTFPRLVRDLARDQSKEVDFEIDGRDIELDRTILTEIRDPLVHILRNAVDHGIEPPEEREAAGKDPTGTIELTASRERDHVTIVVEDDGGGIEADALREKAVEEGVKTEAEVEAMSDAEARELVFHPGFSTNEEVTDVSGRGVGMDVVRTTVKDLDGSVTLDSTPGEGTRFEIKLPVTVAIVRVMFVEVDGVEYGVPIKNIAEVSRASGVDVANGEEVVRHDGDIYPVLRLSEVLGTAGAAGAAGGSGGALADGGREDEAGGDAGRADRDGVDALGDDAPDDAGDGMLLRIREEKRPIALHCDDVLHQEEVVVKPLEGILSGIPGLSGTAVLGDGDVVSILDVETLGGRR